MLGGGPCRLKYMEIRPDGVGELGGRGGGALLAGDPCRLKYMDIRPDGVGKLPMLAGADKERFIEVPPNSLVEWVSIERERRTMAPDARNNYCGYKRLLE